MRRCEENKPGVANLIIPEKLGIEIYTLSNRQLLYADFARTFAALWRANETGIYYIGT